MITRHEYISAMLSLGAIFSGTSLVIYGLYLMEGPIALILSGAVLFAVGTVWAAMTDRPEKQWESRPE